MYVGESVYGSAERGNLIIERTELRTESSFMYEYTAFDVILQ